MGKLNGQLTAIVRKSVTYQKRNCWSNCVVLSAPIILCSLLAIIQMLLDSAITNNSDNKCGCKCVSCEYLANQTRLADDLCPASYLTYNADGSNISPPMKCLKRDTENCGYEYSSKSQIAFCPIRSPSLFPPLFSLPQATERAGDAKTASFLYTGSERAFSDGMAARIVNQPEIAQAAASPAVLSGVQRFLAGAQSFSFDFSFLALAGLDLGAADQYDLNLLYVDFAFLSKEVEVLAKDCSAYSASISALGLQAPEIEALLSSYNCSTANLVYKEDSAQLERELYCGFNKARCDGGSSGAFSNAFDFQDSAPGRLNLVFYHNDTTKISSGGGGGRPASFQRVTQPIDSAVNAYLKEWLGPAHRAEVIAQLEMPKLPFKLILDFSSLLGPLFFVWLMQLPLPITLVQLVYEKEKNLRMMMRMHGLANGSYMLITYCYSIVLYMLYMIITIAFGAGIGLKFFRLNGLGIQLVFYFLYGNVQVAFCFLLSCFFRSSRTAIISAFIWVFGSGIVCLILVDAFFIRERWWTTLLELVPAVSAYRGLWEFAQYSFVAAYKNETAMTFSDIFKDGNGMGTVLIILILEWPVLMSLAWYLEQVIDSGTGIRKHWLFPLHACASRSCVVQPSENFTVAMNMLHDEDSPEDIRKERAKVDTVQPGADHPIVLRDLRKVFPAMDGNPKKLAVENISLVVPKGECFGLLGPNGAGKSTSINMMIGLVEASSGDAFIAGHNIQTEMDVIYKLMGVCPQHDLLWEKLTAREHLNFYGRLKGLTSSVLSGQVDEALTSVNLLDVANKRCGEYSGGMKRRLSVAISLIGSPEVVYMDEPSTGLDPASRRNLWDVVRNAKADKAIILTTHSMEEAEVLCDRLGIFVDGKLVCIGNPKELASRYGGYYMFTISVKEGDEYLAREFVKRISAGATETYALAGTCKFEIPMRDIELSQIFARVSEASANGLDIIDWGVHNASLEDVFIQLASQSEMYTKKTASILPDAPLLDKDATALRPENRDLQMTASHPGAQASRPST